MQTCGIDEAGRGCVIGPLVIAGVVADEQQEKQLIDMGVKDSKLLTPRQRELMFDKIIGIVTSYKIIIIEPGEIDDAVNGKGMLNLNWLEANKSAEIIDELKPEKAILDCPSNNVRQYTDYVKQKLNVKTQLIAEHKADANYPIVGAASILAKVTRDEKIQEIKKKHKVEFGSGYMTDPMTQAFLEKFWDKFPEIFRHSWESYRTAAGIKEQKAQTKLTGFED